MAWSLGYRQQKKNYRRDGEKRCVVVGGCGETCRFVQRSRDKGGGRGHQDACERDHPQACGRHLASDQVEDRGGQDRLVRIEKQTHKSHRIAGRCERGLACPSYVARLVQLYAERGGDPSRDRQGAFTEGGGIRTTLSRAAGGRADHRGVHLGALGGAAHPYSPPDRRGDPGGQPGGSHLARDRDGGRAARDRRGGNHPALVVLPRGGGDHLRPSLPVVCPSAAHVARLFHQHPHGRAHIPHPDRCGGRTAGHHRHFCDHPLQPGGGGGHPGGADRRRLEADDSGGGRPAALHSPPPAGWRGLCGRSPNGR